jgi:hypothetical protein
VTFTCVLTVYLGFTPPSLSFIPTIPFLEQFHCLFVYTCTYKVYRLYSPSSSSPFIVLHPAGTNPPITCFSVLHFLKYILNVQGSFAMVSHMHMLYFNQINPLYCLFFLCCPAPCYSAAFHADCSTIFIHRYNVFRYYSLSFPFPLLLPPSPLRETHHCNHLSFSMYI